MIAPGNTAVEIVLAMAFVIASGYAAGRIHQWYKFCLERDEAFRAGYNEASRSMFDMAMDNRRAKAPEAATGQRVAHDFMNERHAARYATADADRSASAEGIHRRRGVGSARRRITTRIEHRLSRRQPAA